MTRPDRDEMLRALALLVPQGQVTELRAFGVRIDGDWRKQGRVVSGYFADMELLADAALTLRRADGETSAGVYFVPNPIARGMLLKSKNRLAAKVVTATADDHITRRTRLLIDVDPVCCVDGIAIKGIPASEEESAEALRVAYIIEGDLAGEGWPQGVVASSGNGAHLVYEIDLPNDDAALTMVKQVLDALHRRYSTELVQVDQTTCNAARIWKLYGSCSGRGDEDEESGRVYRTARIVSTPDALECVPMVCLQALAVESMAAEAVERQSVEDAREAAKPGFGKRRRDRGDTQPTFDIEGFVRAHLCVQREKAWRGGGRVWVLAECPMCAHGGDGPFVAVHSDGAIAAGCHHDSCQHWGWRELREHCDPDARERRERWGRRLSVSPKKAEEITRLIHQPRPERDPKIARITSAPSARAALNDSDPFGDIDAPGDAREDCATVAEVLAGDVAATRAVTDERVEVLAAPVRAAWFDSQPSEAGLALRLLADLDAESSELVVYDEGSLHQYDDDTGVWAAVARNAAIRRLIAWDGAPIGDSDSATVKINSRSCDGALKLARAEREAQDFFKGASRGFAVRGAYICADTHAGEVRVEPISAKWRATAALDCAYDPDARGPMLTRYLTTIHAGHADEADRVCLMGELVFVALAGLGTHFERAALLYNQEGGSGKSVFIDLIAGLIPRELQTSVAPHDLSDDYKGALLAGKRLNTLNECQEGSVMREKGFKEMISGNQVMRRQIRSEPFVFYPIALHIFSSNELVAAPAASQAFWDRWLVIHFANKFRGTGDEVKDIAAQILKDERAALVAWAIKCGRGLLARRSYTIPASTQRLFGVWRREADNVACWLDSDLVEVLDVTMADERDWAGSADAYKTYKAWCDVNGFRRPVNSRTFAKRLAAHDIRRKRFTAGHRFSVRLLFSPASVLDDDTASFF